MCLDCHSHARFNSVIAKVEKLAEKEKRGNGWRVRNRNNAAFEFDAALDENNLIFQRFLQDDTEANKGIPAELPGVPLQCNQIVEAVEVPELDDELAAARALENAQIDLPDVNPANDTDGAVTDPSIVAFGEGCNEAVAEYEIIIERNDTEDASTTNAHGKQ